MLFATPDFGTGAILVFIVLIAYAIVFLLAAIGVFWGIRLRTSDSGLVRRHGLIIVLACGTVPLGCCLLPPHVVRLSTGTYPLSSHPGSKITNGMNKDEVLAILGPPHERASSGDRESWYYWGDSFGIRWYAVDFQADGRVTGTHFN